MSGPPKVPKGHSNLSLGQRPGSIAQKNTTSRVGAIQEVVARSGVAVSDTDPDSHSSTHASLFDEVPAALGEIG